MALNLGTKAENLEKLRSDFGFQVPDFVAIPFSEFIDDYDVLADSLQSEIELYLLDKKPLDDLLSAIAPLLDSLQIREEKSRTTLASLSMKRWKKVSFRTSAALEDGSEHSFAGQYESFLDIELSKDAIELHVRKTFESMFAERVLLYIKARQLKSFSIGGSVIIQQMFFGKPAVCSLQKMDRAEYKFSIRILGATPS